MRSSRTDGAAIRPARQSLWSGAFRAALVAGACVLVAPSAGLAAQAHAAARHAARQAEVRLLRTHDVRDRSRGGGRIVGWVGSYRPITAERTVLPVLAHVRDSRGRVWLRVRLPGRALGARPLPRTGWISDRSTEQWTTGWHIYVDLGGRRVSGYYDGRLSKTFLAIVGKPSTPTPTGNYFVEETVQLWWGQPGGPFALATSDRSNVLQEFDGGPGQIALHGLDNVGGQLGTAESHGCVRLADSSVSWLAARIGPGVPVTLR
jgi:hypothetical protein